METIYFSLYNDSKFKRNVDNYETMIPSSSSSQPPPFSAFRPSITRGGPQPPSSRNHRPDPSSNSTALRNSLCDSESDLDECRNPGSGTSISYSRILASRNHPLYNKTTPPLTSRSQSRRYSSRYLKNTKRFRRENSTGMMTFLTSLLLSTAIIISISYKSISAATPGHHQHDPNILAVFRDSHEDHEVELERMVSNY